MITSAQIVTQACTICKAPGMTSLGGQCLNLALNDLVLHRDLKVNRYSAAVTVQANSNGPFDLPANYLRTYDLFYTQNDLPYFLRPISMEEYDAEFKDPQISNYPYEYATDLQPQAETPDTGLPLLYIYPQSSGQIELTHRYMINRPDISSPESSSEIPWFQDQDYLIHATATRLMKITDDQRYEAFITAGDKMLMTHIIMEGDEQQVVKEVRLDPKRFRIRRWLKPTKVTD